MSTIRDTKTVVDGTNQAIANALTAIQERAGIPPYDVVALRGSIRVLKVQCEEFLTATDRIYGSGK